MRDYESGDERGAAHLERDEARAERPSPAEYHDVGYEAQQLAEAHLIACSEAMYDAYEDEEPPESPAFGPYCGCDTCIVREVLASAWPALEADAKAVALERDHWIRMFNRLDSAVNHHRRDKGDAWVDEVDDALYAAQDRILKAAAQS